MTPHTRLASFALVLSLMLAGCATPTFTPTPAPSGYGFAWGSNANGQVGSGTVSASSVEPFPISRLGRVLWLAAGESHALAVKSDGTVWAWGDNSSGQLGNGGQLLSRVPVAVRRPAGAMRVAAGRRHSLGVWSDGSVWAWGRGQEGQLGNGGGSDSSAPVRVEMNGATAVAGGGDHSLAVTADGRVWSWGSNSHGQLGTGATGPSNTPMPVPGITSIVAVAAGPRHSLALGADGSVWAWGDNGGGQLGTGTTVNRPAPVRVTGLPPAAAIAAGGDTSVAVARDGSVWAWGDNTLFAIGNPSVPASVVPLQVAGVQGIVSVGAGARHMLTLGSDGRVRGWGYGGPGQLGDGRSMDSAAPVMAVGLPRAVRIAAGGNLSLAISAEVDVLGWGTSGGLGELAAAHNPTPVTIASLGHATAVSAGGDHSLAIGPNGSAWGWGSNIHGQLGVEPAGTIQHTAMHIPSFPSGLVALQAGLNHSLALDANGRVYAWGNNVGGQLGDGMVGEYMTRTQPLQITLPGPAAAIAPGSFHSLALLRDGTVQAWGANARGEIGDGTATGLTPNVGEYIAPFYRPRPVRVINLTSVQRIAAGFEHSLALRSDGTVWTWGANLAGQLGSGTADGIRAAPAQMTGLTGVTAIAAGSFHSLALKSDGTVWAWGANFSGQLGNGTVGNPVASPVRVPGLTAVVAIAAGDRHSLALRSDGTVWTWGGNFNGQLGSGIVDAGRATPAPVPGLTGVTAIAAGSSHSLAIRPAN